MGYPITDNKLKKVLNIYQQHREQFNTEVIMMFIAISLSIQWLPG
jgi:hypothetical protein